MAGKNPYEFMADLERRSKDEINLLVEAGAQFYETAELLELRGQLRERIRIYRILHRWSMMAGASSPFWMILGFAIGAAGWSPGAMILLMLFPLSFFLFLAGVFGLKWRFGGMGHLEYARDLIETELINRRDSMARKRL